MGSRRIQFVLRAEHAGSILVAFLPRRFRHPRTGEPLAFDLPLPADMAGPLRACNPASDER